MIPELGQFALILALLLAVAGGALPVAGAAFSVPSWIHCARSLARAQCGFVGMALACLATSVVSNDFSVMYVARNSNSTLPPAYRVVAIWGGHEGSLLLWTLLLTVWMLAVSLFSKQLPLKVVSRVLGVMSWIDAGFLLLILWTSNPFIRLLPAAMDGRDINGLLQDPGMVSYPPVIYMGYAGFAVAFAFAVSALMSGEPGTTWARWSRPWTIAAWFFLTVGIVLRGAWAYYKLGWDGWRFWDPVDNASLMPWLAGMALIHSLSVGGKRGGFRAWAKLLAISVFSLSLLCTFLVRSGVISPVDAFDTDPSRGVFILAFLSVVMGGSLALFAWRAHQNGVTHPKGPKADNRSLRLLHRLQREAADDSK